MIDIHSHILPELDDGARTVYDSIGMAKELVDAGFHAVIATPHVLEGREALCPDKIRQSVKDLNQVLKQKQIPLKVLPGAENYIFPDLAKWYSEGKILSLADTNKYILIELPMVNVPPYTEKVFFDLQTQGVNPILAHPERNKELVKSPQQLVEWANSGIKYQVNLKSFMGRFGPEAQNLAIELLENNMIHFVGSDLHNKSSSDSIYKSLMLIKNRYEAETLTQIAASNSGYILKGETWTESNRVYAFKQKEKQGFLRDIILSFKHIIYGNNTNNTRKIYERHRNNQC